MTVFRFNLISLLLGVVLFLIGACQVPRSSEKSAMNQTALDAAQAFEVLNGHNRRVALLQQLATRGVIEMRWIDDEGNERSEPQINARLWLDLPHRSALRGEKMGEELFWLGSDETRYWLFDLLNDPNALYLGTNRNEVALVEDSAMQIRPAVLLDLMALMELLTDLPLTSVQDESGRALWKATQRDASGGANVYFDRSSRLVVRVEILDRAGVVALRSELSRFKTVVVPGAAFAARPKFPTMIEVADAKASFQVKLALDEPTGDVSNEPLERVFDFERLRERFDPAVTYDADQPQPMTKDESEATP